MKRPAVAAPALALALGLALLAAACGSTAPSTPAVAPTSAEPSVPAADGPRPIVFDTDMGMDDLLALFMILRDPTLDVRAIAIDGTGLVHCGPGIRNMHQILTAFDRLDIPFGCGREEPGPNGRAFPEEWRASSDAMYGVVLPPAVMTATPDAVTLLRDAITGAPGPVTVLAVGTWTNLQDLFAAAPDLVERIREIHSMAGVIDDPGNVELGATTPADQVEWNVGADPDSFAAVLALDVPVTLVPLDATNDVPVPADIVASLAEDHAAAGADIAYEAYLRSPYLAGEGSYWWDATAAVLLGQRGYGTWDQLNVTVTPNGSAAGRINRDDAGRPVTVAKAATTDLVQNAILEGLRRGAPRPEPFTTAGTLAMTWDGTACRIEGEPPTKAGVIQVTLANRGTGPVGALGAGVVPPKTWDDVLAWLKGVDITDQATVPPEWIIPMQGQGVVAEAGATITDLLQMPAGPVGVLCGSGRWPDITFVNGGSFTLAD